MQFPLTCPSCRHLQMVDVETLTEKSVDKIRTSRGYECENCGQFNALYYVTISLRESFEKLKRRRITHPDFHFHFAKTLKKALSSQGK